MWMIPHYFQRSQTCAASPVCVDPTSAGPIMAEDSGFEENLKKFKYQRITEVNTRNKHQIQTKTTYVGGGTEKDAKIFRVTIGEKNPLKPNKTILLVGETGAGKSTFIDGMLTHLMGATYEDNAWCTIIGGEKEGGIKKEKKKSESQTEAITIYEIFELANDNFPYSLTIIDTPGFGDTIDVGKDEIISTGLEYLILAVDGIKELDAVGFVLTEATPRLSDRQSYIFNSVVSLFGKDLEKNIVALITSSNGGTPTVALQTLEDADIMITKRENKEPIFFLFNNLNTVSNNERDKKVHKRTWKTSKNGMEEFLNFLKEVRPQDLKQTAEVLTNRNQILACCNTLKERIEFIELKETMIGQLKKGVEKLDSEAKNAVMDIQVDEAYKALVDIVDNGWLTLNSKATHCPKCEENCHYPGCTTAIDPRTCEVMDKNGNCTACVKKCPDSVHVKDKQKYVALTRKATKTVEDIKKKYEIEGKKGEKEKLLAGIQSDLDGKRKEKENMIDQIYQYTVKLEDIAMERSAIATYLHLDFVLKHIEKEGNDERVKRLTEVKDRIMHKEGQKKGIQFMIKEKLLLLQAKAGQKVAIQPK